MRQRVMIAVALSCKPSLLVADEPTTALDVTVQAQILALLRELQAGTGTAILLITHNLGLVAENCDTVAVMYAGKVVERAPMRALFRDPRHPYTQGLLRAVPRLDHPPKQPLPTIAGIVPNPLRLPSGCRFRARCPWEIARCAQEEPPLLDLGGGHASACWVQPDFRATPPAAGAEAQGPRSRDADTGDSAPPADPDAAARAAEPADIAAAGAEAKDRASEAAGSGVAAGAGTPPAGPGAEANAEAGAGGAAPAAEKGGAG
jgi:oligopeptide/dipeptide ABC transporter ATP-binding protein